MEEEYKGEKEMLEQFFKGEMDREKEKMEMEEKCLIEKL